MDENEAQVFSGITPEQFARLTEKAKDSGIEIRGNSGSASEFGVEVAWNYVPETQQLSLHCLKTPFFISADHINGKIRTLVKESAE